MMAPSPLYYQHYINISYWKGRETKMEGTKAGMRKKNSERLLTPSEGSEFNSLSRQGWSP